ncbi:sulfotransferase family protein [Methylobacillus flagellatus]|uniref:sulfotransferase family protein n=1 Tax=Methylobacillus flagellatus TaxID=405 RepID=UPI0010F8C3FE|nr:sulfotransferase [Methylobacillus flagellatus]
MTDQYHIHIVGCVPRSGTTLMTELMVNCFNIDAYTAHEYSIYKEFPHDYQILCTKKPNDIERVTYPLKVNPQLYVIYLLRDPRDAISSRSHAKNNEDKKIWGNLRTWLDHQAIADSLSQHPRFITIRYEDLVSAPDATQDRLLQQLPFLSRRVKFSEFHTVAKPSEKSQAALGEIRPISAASVGNWRKHKAYLKAQVEKYGDISDILIRLGYELDKQWLEEFKDVVADNSDEPEKVMPKWKQYWMRYLTTPRRKLLYRLSISPTFGKCINRLRHGIRTNVRNDTHA